MFMHIVKQQILWEDYFSRFGPITDFRFSKCKGGPQRIGQIFMLRSDRLENSVRMTAMARFVYNLRSNMYPNRLSLRDMSKKTDFFTGPPGPNVRKKSNLS